MRVLAVLVVLQDLDLHEVGAEDGHFGLATAAVALGGGRGRGVRGQGGEGEAGGGSGERRCSHVVEVRMWLRRGLGDERGDGGVEEGVELHCVVGDGLDERGAGGVVLGVGGGVDGLGACGGGRGCHDASGWAFLLVVVVVVFFRGGGVWVPYASKVGPDPASRTLKAHLTPFLEVVHATAG